jgi:hypothetical protein
VCLAAADTAVNQNGSEQMRLWVWFAAPFRGYAKLRGSYGGAGGAKLRDSYELGVWSYELGVWSYELGVWSYELGFPAPVEVTRKLRGSYG